MLTLPTPEVTRQLGRILSQLPAGRNLLLQGDLGSGKTTLAQGLGSGLGIAEPLASPTFALLHEYHDGRVPLYHFDLYRLEPEQVGALAPEAYWEGSEFPSGIVLIEWCDRLPYTPDQALRVHLAPIALGGVNQSDGPDPSSVGRVATLSVTGNPDIDLAAIAQDFEASLLAVKE